MTNAGRALSIALGAALLVLGQTARAQGGAADCPPGAYRGGATEIAAAIDLNADGTYFYALAYGALDEESQGTWRADAGTIVLASAAYSAPRIALVEDKPATDRTLHIALAVPEGLSREFFDVYFEMPDGSWTTEQMRGDGLTFDLATGTPPVALRLVLPIYQIVSERVTLVDPARDLAFRFEANDIGKVVFADEALACDKGDLMLKRHQREVRLRRVADNQPD